MKLNQAIKNYTIYLKKNKMTVFGGNTEGAIARDFIDKICRLLTGFRHTKIIIKTDWYKDDSQYVYNYHLSNGDKYQYNKFVLNKNFELVRVDGDAERQIVKLFDFIKYISYEKIMEWESTDSMITHIGYYWDCDDRDESKSSYDKYIKLDEDTRKKYMKLNSIHQKLLLESNERIDEILDIMLPVWEAGNFKTSGWLGQETEGKFSDNKIPAIKNLKNGKSKEIIIFPNDSRGSICSQFLILEYNHMNKVLKMPIGKKITLRNIRKGSKNTQYQILDHKNDFSTAVKNIKTGKTEFITFYHMADSCYDALFSENKKIYRGWFNKRCKLIKYGK